MIKLFVCDLDGTLLRWFDKENAVVSEMDLRAIKELRSNGINFLVNSSRKLDFIDVFEADLKGVDMIAGAGTAIRIKQKIIRNLYFPNREIEELIEYFKDLKFCQLLAVTSKNRMISTNLENSRYLSLIDDEITREYGELSSITLMDYKFSSDEKVLFFYVNGDLDDNISFYRRLMADLPQFEVIICGEGAAQITPQGVNKLTALQEVMDSIQLQKSEVAVIGDSYNDISMFEGFKYSFVMSHAAEEVKKHANYVVDSVAAAIDIVLKENL